MQKGGTKIVRAGEIVDELSNESFGKICTAVDRLDIKAVGSACALIVNAHINTDMDTGIVCRSDVFGVSGKKLTSRGDAPTTGAIVGNLILKCFIIQPNNEPKLTPYKKPRRFDAIRDYFSRRFGLGDENTPHTKETTTIEEAVQENASQKLMYSVTKKIMNPVCPDTLGVLVFDAAQFAEFLRHYPLFGANSVFQYLNAQVREHPRERRVGIMVMDSIPPNYAPLDKLERGMPQFEHYSELCILSAAIYCILIAKAHKIPIDPHTGNWMGSGASVESLDVIAIDMGRVLDIDNPAFKVKLRGYIDTYFKGSGHAIHPSTRSKSKTDLQECMRSDSHFIDTLLRTITGIPPDCTTLWPQARSAESLHGRVPENLNSIHKLFVLGACCDGFQNNDVFDFNFCQIRFILQEVYHNDHFDSLDNIIPNVSLDLNVYLQTLLPDNRALILRNLTSVSEYIQQRTPLREVGLGSAGSGGSGAQQSRKKQTRRRYRKKWHHRRSGGGGGGIKRGKRTLKHYKIKYTQ
jgi:hypothetical protein